MSGEGSGTENFGCQKRKNQPYPTAHWRLCECVTN